MYTLQSVNQLEISSDEVNMFVKCTPPQTRLLYKLIGTCNRNDTHYVVTSSRHLNNFAMINELDMNSSMKKTFKNQYKVERLKIDFYTNSYIETT